MRISLIMDASQYQNIRPRKVGRSSGSYASTTASIPRTTNSNSNSSGGNTSGTRSRGPDNTSSAPKLVTVGSPYSSTSAAAYEYGGGNAVTIPRGHPFAGRTAGGATRGQVYGTKMYGSGYPGYHSPGVAGLGFPFWFWPVVWGGTATPDSHRKYLYSPEYGDSFNTSRPGGPMAEATFISRHTKSTFHLLSDNSTVVSLIHNVDAHCSPLLAPPTPRSPSRLNASALNSPQPEQAIQYYRASSIVLTLDGYNNSATFSNSPNTTPDSPLPSGVDTILLNCLNHTIGRAAPLVGGASSLTPSPCIGLVSLVWVFWVLTHYA